MFEANKIVHQVPISQIDTTDRSATRDTLGDLIGLSRSIEDKGLINPIILNKSDDGTFVLMSGLRRLEACRILKWEEVAARFYSDLNKYEQRLIYVEGELAHKENLSWQEDAKLKKELHELYVKFYGSKPTEEPLVPQLVKPGPKPKWSKRKTASMLNVPKSALIQDIKLAEMMERHPELAKAVSKQDAINKMYRVAERAILAEIARRKIEEGTTKDDPIIFVNQDCFEYMKTIEDESIDFIITDPPWGIDIGTIGKRRLDYKIFDDKDAAGRSVYTKAIKEFARILKDGSHLWIFHSQLDHLFLLQSLSDNGFCPASLSCVWVKEGAPSYTNKYDYQPMPGYELFTFAYKGKHPRRLNTPCNNVFTYKRATNPIHPTEKPLELIKRLVGLSSNSGDVGLDPFAGSGAFLQACLVSDRKGVACEIDEKLFAAASGRLQTMMIQARDELGEEKSANTPT